MTCKKNFQSLPITCMSNGKNSHTGAKTLARAVWIGVFIPATVCAAICSRYHTFVSRRPELFAEESNTGACNVITVHLQAVSVYIAHESLHAATKQTVFVITV